MESMKNQGMWVLVLVVTYPWSGYAQGCVQQVQCPAQGQDLVIALNACIGRVQKSCGNTGGTCDARSCGGSYVASEPLGNPEAIPITVLLGNSKLTVSNSYFINSAGWNYFKLIGEGDNSVITMPGGSTAIRMKPLDANSYLKGVRISGVHFHGTMPLVSSGGMAITLFNCQDCEIDHNSFDTFPMNAVFLQSTSATARSNHTHIHNNSTTNMWGSNFLIGSYSQENQIDHNSCHATHCDCIDINGDHNVIQQNVADTVVRVGSKCTPGDTRGVNVFQAADWPTADGNVISDNQIRAPDTQCISVQGSSPDGISETKISGNTCELSRKEGILVSTLKAGQSKNIEVTGNTVNQAAGSGILVGGVQDALIANNKVSASQCSSFQFNDVRDITVKENIAQQTNSSGSGRQNPGCDGFLFFGSADGVKFDGNQDNSTQSAHSLEIFKTAGPIRNFTIGTNSLPKGQTRR
jgi:hypothetical protein